MFCNPFFKYLQMKTKSSACGTLAPSAVASATSSYRASVHPLEGFCLMELSQQKQLLTLWQGFMHCMKSLPYFYENAWYLWYGSQTTCVLLLDYRTFMSTPFAQNSLTLKQALGGGFVLKSRYAKPAKHLLIHTIGIHAFFINLLSAIPYPMHDSLPFMPHPMPNAVFVFEGCGTQQKKSRAFIAKDRLLV